MLSSNELYTASFASFDRSPFARDFEDPRNGGHPHALVVSYLLTLFQRSTCRNHAFLRIVFGMSRDVWRSVEAGLSAV
jgi:hypothetical protein